MKPWGNNGEGAAHAGGAAGSNWWHWAEDPTGFVCWGWLQPFCFIFALFLALSKIRTRKKGENPGLLFRAGDEPPLPLTPRMALVMLFNLPLLGRVLCDEKRRKGGEGSANGAVAGGQS